MPLFLPTVVAEREEREREGDENEEEEKRNIEKFLLPFFFSKQRGEGETPAALLASALIIQSEWKWCFLLSKNAAG